MNASSASVKHFLLEKKVIVAGLLLLTVIAGFKVIAIKNEVDLGDIKKVNSYVYKNDCKGALNASRELSVSQSNLNNSIELLNIRASCYSSLMQYGQAIATLKQLKAYYQRKKDTAAVSLTEQHIKDEEYNLSYEGSKKQRLDQNAKKVKENTASVDRVSELAQ